jgi:hypothetical protein
MSTDGRVTWVRTEEAEEDGDRRVVVAVATLLALLLLAGGGATAAEATVAVASLGPWGIMVHSGSGMVGRKGWASTADGKVRWVVLGLSMLCGESRIRPDTSGPNWKDSASAVGTVRSGCALARWGSGGMAGFRWPMDRGEMMVTVLRSLRGWGPWSKLGREGEGRSAGEVLDRVSWRGVRGEELV